ncbi:MAG: hypothetical protein ACK5LT_01760 [Lachnospirales bacterium]
MLKKIFSTFLATILTLTSVVVSPITAQGAGNGDTVRFYCIC